MTSISKLSLRQFSWDSAVLAVTLFWLSSSALLDFLVMPLMYESGMMEQPGFASAGYSLFWAFNRVEVLCAALILTGLLVLRQRQTEFSLLVSGSRSRWSMMIGVGLLAIALLYTYLLTPEMSALGISLGETTAIPTAMNWMHAAYWGLEVLKLAAAGFLLRLCYQDVVAQFDR
ncbi:MAG: hypothetical protein F6J97_25220 [Leptolyngbya sp. SIO4C1]|nr:hypothetical protein [Leptolyngbya sp. SIO4C1]